MGIDRNFYKFVFIKGPLLGRTRADVKRSQQQIRIAARRRVYDTMRYLTKHRLYDPFQPLGSQFLRPSRRQRKGNPLLTLSPSSSEEETTQIHFDMLTLLSAGIHPHFLLHHHLIHPNTDPFFRRFARRRRRSQPKPTPAAATAQARGSIVPGYPFLSAARYLIEANMKEAWGNLINIAQDLGGVVDGDEDGDYGDAGEG